jgi:hypothetical protein
MTDIDLIDWTLQEAQQLRNEEVSDSGAPSSLSRLLSVLAILWSRAETSLPPRSSALPGNRLLCFPRPPVRPLPWRK